MRFQLDVAHQLGLDLQLDDRLVVLQLEQDSGSEYRPAADLGFVGAVVEKQLERPQEIVFERKRLGRVGRVGVPGEELEPADAELRAEVELQYDPKGVHLPPGGVLSLEGGLTVVVDHQGQDRIEILEHARRRNHTPPLEQAKGDILGLVGQFRRHPAFPGAEVDHSPGSVSRLDRLRPDDVDRRDAVAAAAPLDAALPAEDYRAPVRRTPRESDDQYSRKQP